MRKLKLAFIGGGVNSAVGTTHKIASQMDGRFELVAGCFAPTDEINQETKNAWNTDRVYLDWRELLKSEKGEIEAVAVITPTSMHTEIVIEAIRSGYPVICEKALTTSVSDALKIKDALEEYKGYLAVVYNYTGYPMLRELKSMIKRKDFGKIQQVHVEMPQEGFARTNANGKPVVPQDWRLKDGEIPTVSLDLGAHLHNQIAFLTGEKPLEVIAIQNTFGFFPQIIDNVISIAKYSNDLICNIWYGKTALGYRNGFRVRVCGEKKAAEWYQLDPEKLLIHDNQGHSQVIDRGNIDASISSAPRYTRFKVGHPAGFIEAFANYYDDIADSIIAFKEKKNVRSEYVFGIDDALEGLIMLEAVSKSAKSKSWEKVKV